MQSQLAYLGGRANPDKSKGKKSGGGGTDDLGGEYQTILEQEYFDFVLFDLFVVAFRAAMTRFDRRTSCGEVTLLAFRERTFFIASAKSSPLLISEGSGVSGTPQWTSASHATWNSFRRTRRNASRAKPFECTHQKRLFDHERKGK